MTNFLNSAIGMYEFLYINRKIPQQVLIRNFFPFNILSFFLNIKYITKPSGKSSKDKIKLIGISVLVDEGVVNLLLIRFKHKQAFF
jgi:hypothetical protein